MFTFLRVPYQCLLDSGAELTRFDIFSETAFKINSRIKKKNETIKKNDFSKKSNFLKNFDIFENLIFQRFKKNSKLFKKLDTMCTTIINY